MTRTLLLAVDCSTTASKVVAFDLTGRAVAETRHYLATTNPGPGRYEQDPEQWWRATADALAAVTSMLGPDDEVLALGLTNQRETFACLDAAGAALRPALLWLDGRATAEIERLGSHRVHQLTGKPPSSAPSSYKLAWLWANEPDTAARTRVVTDVQGFLALRLTGHRRTSSASADSTGLVDVVQRVWHPDLVAETGVPLEVLPELVAPGDLLGVVSAEAAVRTGLPRGLPVIAGLGDGQAGVVGTGVLDAGRVTLNAGTSLALGAPTDHYTWGPAFRTFAGPTRSTFVLECLTPAGGLSLTWFRDHVAGGRSVAELEAEARAIPAVRHGALFLPHLTGVVSPHQDPWARGAFVGLGAEHGAAAMYRAVLEGLALEQRRALGTLEAVLGSRVREVIATGGLAQSELVLQTVADALGRPVSVARERESTALGAAIVAAAGSHLRVFPRLEDAAAAMTGIGRRVSPDPATRTAYDDAAEVHAALYPTLAPLGPAIARLRDTPPEAP